jgi:broad specificity phosphatase PhoE
MTVALPQVCVYFIRHGATEWSVSGKHTGRTDLPLTAAGEDEARRMRPAFRDIEFAHVLTSPLQRARRTCELARIGRSAEVVPDLTEWDYGDYEGLRSVDVRESRPDWDLFRDGCPRGESPAQVSGRADRIIERLRTYSGNVALFSSGQFGCVLAARWIGLPVLDAQHFAVGTASLGIFGYDPHHPEVAVISGWGIKTFGTCAPEPRDDDA